MNTTQGRLYIVSVNNPSDRLDIQFVPDVLEYDRRSNAATVHVIGQNTPKYFYGSGETTMPLKLDFFADTENRKDVLTKCRWLESFTYNDGSLGTPPSRVMLIFGDMFKSQVWSVLSFKARYSLFNKKYGFMPQQAYVDIVLGLDPDKNLRQSTVRYV